jgi:hypothetical protein
MDILQRKMYLFMVHNFLLYKDIIMNVEFFQNFLEIIHQCLDIILVLLKFHNLNKQQQGQFF